MNYFYKHKIDIPGKMRFFKISVPVAVALIKQTLADSSAACPWSPHNLNLKNNDP